MIRRMETPHARMALISLSAESRPNTSIVETRAEMGIDMESVPGKPNPRNCKTLMNEAPPAMYLVALNSNPTIMTKLRTTSDVRNVETRFCAM